MADMLLVARMSRTAVLLCSRIIRSPDDLRRKKLYGSLTRWSTNPIVRPMSSRVRSSSRRLARRNADTKLYPMIATTPTVSTSRRW